MAALKPLRGGYYIWKYLPSLPAAAIFAVLFLVVTIAHGWRISKTKLWFCFPVFIGGFMEVIGYIARIACHFDTSKLGSYIIQQMFILLPPVLFAASIYMILGRIIIACHGEQYSPIRPSRLTKTFLAGDIISFYIQGGGGGLTAAGSRSTGTGISLASLGQWVVVGGLILQILIFGPFCLTAVTFHRRYEGSVQGVAPVWREWKTMMRMLYVVSGLIMVRNLFRVVEFVDGTDGYLVREEWGMYIFDAVLMLLVLGCFFWWHPMRIPGLVKGHVRASSVEEALREEGGGCESGIRLVTVRAQSKY